VQLVSASKTLHVTWKAPHDDKNVVTAITITQGEGEGSKEVVKPSYFKNNTAIIPWNNFNADQKLSVKIAAFTIVATEPLPNEPQELGDLKFFASGPPINVTAYTIMTPVQGGVGPSQAFDDRRTSEFTLIKRVVHH
jgi:hypothetical protein